MKDMNNRLRFGIKYNSNLNASEQKQRKEQSAFFVLQQEVYHVFFFQFSIG